MSGLVLTFGEQMVLRLASGLIIFLGMLGMDFTSLAIIAGGQSVGIGIGLQDIVANFTTKQVKNLTRSDRLVRVLVSLSVSYASEPELIRQIAITIGLQHDLVLADPAPSVLFRGYGESSIDFDLAVSANQPELQTS